MAKTTKAGATPSLRFPEYRESQAWSEAKVGQLVTTVTPPVKLQTSSYMAEGVFPIVDQSKDQFCGWTDDTHAVITGPLPLVVFGDHTCALKIVRQPFAQGADGIKILRANNLVDAEFLFQLLSHHPLEAEDYKRHFSTLRERRVFFPDIKTGEQQRIADCLTSLDDVIAAQARKVEALKTHRQGLMQKLFPREGETEPRLRFPEFRDAPGWRELTIGTWGRTIAGLSGKAGSDFGEGVPYVTYKQVFDRSSVDFSQCGRVRVVEDEKQNELKYGDILITGSSETPEEVAFASVVLDNPPEPTFLNSFCFCVRPNQEAELSTHFLQYLFHSPIYRRRVQLLAQGSTRFNISKSAFLRLTLPLPADGAEQRAIAKCLASCEDQIEAETEMLNAVKRHKAGLMQQLFPSPDQD